ncbi:hypothetical protein [Rhizobium phaseoli]|uniref:Holin n=1 Tax=Rhizobium phaseoli TaxID=396 RepID=A0ABN4QJP4_9HYPH|nr:hypothetical protein [Rhizobium phaseoli]ANL84688.1 hypothetical protein AMC81_CH01907 [Rhizobium phaseoli]ANL91195.1 hypothetical protein AMC80_CH01907 [Rhizobium phaseoli]
MKFASDWKRVLQRAWSIRLMLIAGLLSGIEFAIPYLDGYVDIPPRLFAALSGFTVAAAFVARLLAQKDVADGK